MRKHRILGELSILFSGLLFAAVAVLVKGLSGDFSGLFITLFRFVTAIVLGCLVLAFVKNGFRVEDKKDVFLRGLFGSASMILYYTSIALSSSGRASMLNTTYPVFVVLFGALFFKHKIGVRRWIALAVCMAGVVLILVDREHYGIWGDLAGLASGVCGGVAILYMKKARERNNAVMIYMATCVLGLPVALVSAPQFTLLTLPAAFVLVGTGALVFVAQVMFTWGIKYTSAARGSLISFSKVPITVFAGCLFLAEPLTLRFVIGSLLILAGIVSEKDWKPLSHWRGADKERQE